MSDLQALNPQAATLQVPCRPSQFPDSVNVWAVQSGTGHIVTDEQPDELQNVARLASVFIEFNGDAPYENAEIMASRYGLACPNITRDEPTESESIRNKEPCPDDVTQLNGRQNWMAEPGKPKCDTSGQPKAAKKDPIHIKVCVRPSWLPAPYKNNEGKWVTVDKWAIVFDDKKVEWTDKPKSYEELVKKADVIFTLDESAPPESAYYFTQDPKKLSCPSGLPKKSYEDVAAAGEMPLLSDVTAHSEAKEKAAEAKKQGGGKTTNGSTTTTGGAPTANATPKKGDGETTETSSPTGKGPPLSTFERFARNMSLGAAVASMDTSGNAKHPEGDRHGMVNGTNVGGWSFPALQAGLSAIQIITAVGVPSKEFVLKIYTATKGGQRVIINEADKAALKMADELIKEAGQYELAKAFQEISAVLPFKLGQKFTAGLESKFQAHKIFEKQAFEKFPNIFGRKGANQGFEEAIEKAPSVILTDAEHKAITKELNDFWTKIRKAPPPPAQLKKELVAKYQDVYKDHPHWMQAIQHLIKQLPE